MQAKRSSKYLVEESHAGLYWSTVCTCWIACTRIKVFRSNALKQLGLRTLQADLHSAFVTRRSALRKIWEKVSDVVPGMPIQTSSQPLLVEIMRD